MKSNELPNGLIVARNAKKDFHVCLKTKLNKIFVYQEVDRKKKVFVVTKEPPKLLFLNTPLMSNCFVCQCLSINPQGKESLFVRDGASPK